MLVLFLLTVLTVVSLIHLYLWRRLVRDTTLPGRWRRVGGFVVLALAVLVPLTLIGTRALPHSTRAALAWPGYLWLALMFYLLVVLLVLELPRLAVWLVLRRRTRRAPFAPAPSASTAAPSTSTAAASASTAAPPTSTAAALTSAAAAATSAAAAADGGGAASVVPAGPSDDAPADPSRRLFIARGAAVVAGLTAISTVGYGVRTALGPPELLHVPVKLTKLPASMSGFKIAVVSDIHVGPLLGRAHTERIVRIINGAGVDLVAVVGDVVDGTVEDMGRAVEPLQDLRARHGAFFVTGNHEYFSGHEPWITEIERLGLDVLRNQRVAIDGLDLAGVTDPAGAAYDDGPDFEAALGGRDRNRPTVLLAHQPINVHDAARHGVDLQLSGHTHGGQIVPFNLVVAAEQPVVKGLATVDGTQVYVTKGAGFWGPPVRVGARPDISVVTLEGT